MKIIKIETVRLTSRPTLIWVRVHTDEGLIGLGESCAFYYGWYHECLDRLPPIEHGRIRAPEGNGLGVALHPDLLLRHDVVARTSGL